VFVSRFGLLNQTLGICVSPLGTLYAVEWGNRAVQAFTTGGTELFSWGGVGAGNGQFNGPTRIAADHDGHLYVSDSDNKRIQMFSTTGAYLGQWGAPGQNSPSGNFAYPFGIACDPDGNVYVVDGTNCRVQKFGHAVVAAKTQSWGRLKALYR
jgi:DNA-binding beta-propeller fold protein YncE